jgi:20S proteasome subunit beta 2
VESTARPAGVYNDLGSGSNVDLCIITKDGVAYKRNIEYLQDKLFTRQFPIDFKAKPAPVTKQVQMLTLTDVHVVDGEPEAMDTS